MCPTLSTRRAAAAALAPAVAGLLAACLLAACARHAPLPAPPAPAAPALGAVSGLRVLLVWDAPVDLDLYLTDPTSTAAYFGNNPSRTGARLVRDTRCADVRETDTPFMEVTYMPQPLAGRYRVGVDYIDACAAGHAPVSFRVAVEYAGRRHEVSGTIRLEEFQPIVVEFDLQRAQERGALSLQPAAPSEEGKQ